MTNAQIAALMVADPLVQEKLTKFGREGPIAPSPALVESLAQAALQNELNALLDVESIRRVLLEADYSLTLSSGTEITQGFRFILPERIASVVNITIGDDCRPLDKKKTRVDFDRWYYEQPDSEVAQCWTPWGRSGKNRLQILIAPGVGSDTTANVHFVKKVTQPVSMPVLPDDIHDLVVLGVRNRLTGYALQGAYRERLAQVARRLNPMIGGASPMPHNKEMREFNCSMASDYT